MYKELNIGVARPSQQELASVQHHFIASHSVHHELDVATYEKEAIDKITSLFLHNDYVVVAGGSGLYIDAILYGIDEMPQNDEEIAAELKAIWEKQGLTPLLEELERSDPEYYQTVDQSNPVRILRALNVIRSSGKPFSEFRKKKAAKRDFKAHFFYIDIPRPILYERINRRVEIMLGSGLEEEVKQVKIYRDSRALNSVGYAEWPEDGVKDEKQRAEIIEKIKQFSRNYAKRQVTWFKKKPIIEIQWHEDVYVMKDRVLEILRTN